MPRISKEEARRRMDEILKEQMERPTLRPSDQSEEAHNPFRPWSATGPITQPFDERKAAD